MKEEAAEEVADAELDEEGEKEKGVLEGIISVLFRNRGAMYGGGKRKEKGCGRQWRGDGKEDKKEKKIEIIMRGTVGRVRNGWIILNECGSRWETVEPGVWTLCSQAQCDNGGNQLLWKVKKKAVRGGSWDRKG